MGQLMLYGTGGIGFLGYRGFTDAGTHFAGSKTLTGWTAGAGVEWAYNSHIHARVEYLHSEFGKSNIMYDVPYAVRPKLDVVRLGVSFQF